MEKVIKIPDEIVTDLKILAAKSGKSLSAYITGVLVELVKTEP